MTKTRALRLLMACIAATAMVACDDDPMNDAGTGDDAGPGMADAGPGMNDAGPGMDDAGPGTDAGPNLAPEGVIDTPMMAVTINEGETVDFTATCTDPEGGTTTHAWDFDGGAAASTMEDPGAVQFDTAGAYTVTYTCTDDQGNADATPATVMVAVNANTMATIDAPVMDVVIAVGETVDFQGSCVDPEMDMTLTHAWDFMGGAAASTMEDPGPVQFDTAGMYVVTYTCSDSAGGMGSAMITVTVNTPPEGVIDMPAGSVRIAPGGMVDFQATCTDADGDVALTHAWDFGGGATASTMEDPGVVTFSMAGVYTVTYVCTDSLGFADPTPATVTVRVAIPTRFVAYTGDIFVDLQTQVALTDISGATPSAPIDPIAGGWPAFGDMASTSAIRLSEDGRYLAFVADATTDTSDDLYVVDLNAASPVAVNLTNLPSGRDVEHFELSPDGQKVAYTADVTTAGEDELYVVDYSAGLGAATTVRAHGVLPTGGDVFPTFYSTTNDDFAWNAASTKVYFRGEVTTDTVAEAYMFDLGNVAAGAQRLHAAPVTGGDVQSIYAAGNDIVLFIGDLLVDNASDVFAVDTSAAGPYTAVRVSPTAATSTQEATVSFSTNGASTDGTRFVFRGDFTMNGAFDLYGLDLTAALTTGAAVNLTGFTMTFQSTGTAKWDPTSNRLLYIADEAFSSADDLFLIDYTTATPSMPVPVNTPVTASAQDVDNFTWAPDGSGVAFDGDLGATDNVDELYYTPLPAGAAPGAMVTLSQTFPSTADADGNVFWLSPTQLVFVADPLTASQDNLYVVSTTMPGMATQLNAPHAAASGFPNFSAFQTAVTRDGAFIVARADSNESGVTELFLFDPAAPGVNTLLHPTFVGTSQDVSFVVDEL